MAFRRATTVAVFLALVCAAARAAEVRLDERDPYLRVASALLVGNKGDVAFDVSLAPGACGEVWVFDRAELEIVRNRFGGAQFIELPPGGCRDCAPGRIRWYHEPTGHLAFDVHVFRRREMVPCTETAPSGAGDAPG